MANGRSVGNIMITGLPAVEELSVVAARVRRGVVAVRSADGSGAGVIWDGDGRVVTAAHVVRRGPLTVEDAEGRTYEATLERSDEGNDLALLRIPSSNLEPPAWAFDAPVRTGQLVLAVGNPWAIPGSVSFGIVFGTGEVTPDNRVSLPGAIYADLRLEPGNSGGPFVDARGRVLGIASMVSGGMAVAIPAATVRRFVENVI